MFPLKKSEKSAPAEATESSASPKATHGSTRADRASAPAAEQTEARPNRHPQEKKGVPTPTRKEREAARKRPLVVTDPAEAKKRRRAEQAAAAEKTREAFRTGDDRYLPLQHRGENRRLIRNVIDERFRIGELLIFLAIPYFLFSFLFAGNLQLSQILSYVFLGFIAIMAIEIFFVTRKVRARQRAAGVTGQRSDVFYIFQRISMFRRFRMPAAGV